MACARSRHHGKALGHDLIPGHKIDGQPILAIWGHEVTLAGKPLQFLSDDQDGGDDVLVIEFLIGRRTVYYFQGNGIKDYGKTAGSPQQIVVIKLIEEMFSRLEILATSSQCVKHACKARITPVKLLTGCCGGTRD